MWMSLKLEDQAAGSEVYVKIIRIWTEVVAVGLAVLGRSLMRIPEI